MMLLDKYHKRFNMFSHKHRHNKEDQQDDDVINNNTNTNINNSNNSSSIPLVDPIILPQNVVSSDDTFVDPRQQYNMVTPINSNNNNLYSYNNNNNNNSNNAFSMQQPQFNYGKFAGSATSLASSLNSEYTLPINNAASNTYTNNNLTKQFVSLLMEIYQLLSSDPTVTPFDTTNPPSGILNRVGKLAIENANSTNLEILATGNVMMMNSNTLLAIIRHHLLVEIRKDGYLSRNVSLASLPQSSIFTTIPTTTTQQPLLKRTNTMDNVQNNITNITGGMQNNGENSVGLGTGLGSSINLNIHPGISNMNPLLARSTSRTSSPLAFKPRNYNHKPY